MRKALPSNASLRVWQRASPHGATLRTVILTLSIALIGLAVMARAEAVWLQWQGDHHRALQRLTQALNSAGGLAAIQHDWADWGFTTVSEDREALRTSPTHTLRAWLPGNVRRGLIAPPSGGTAKIIYYVWQGGFDNQTVQRAALGALSRYALLTAALGALGLLVALVMMRRVATPLGDRLGAADAHPNAEPVPQASLAELQALEPMALPWILIDRELRIASISPAAAALVGWDAQDSVSQLLYSVFQALDLDGQPALNPGERCIATGVAAGPVAMQLRVRGSEARVAVDSWARPWDLGEGRLGACMMLLAHSERTERMQLLHSRLALQERVVDQLPLAVLTVASGGTILSANLAALQLFGFTQDELAAQNLSRLLPVPFLHNPDASLNDFQRGQHNARTPRVVGWRKDTATFPAEITVSSVRLGEDLRYVLTVVDISATLRSQSLEQRLGRLLDQSSDEIYIFDAASLLFLEVNRTAADRLKRSREALLRLSLLDISLGLDAASFESYLTQLRKGEPGPVTYRSHHQRQDGSQYPVEVRVSYSPKENPPVFMAVAQDITERAATERRMRELAHFDALTGLPNRSLLQDRMAQALTLARRTQRMVAVYFLDLDGFKPVNDRYGHEAGDELLKQVAQRLQLGVRGGDTVARLGGDEFVVLAIGVNDLNDATTLGWKLIERFEARFELSTATVQLGVSVGAVLFPQHANDADSLLRFADEAMYRAKHSSTQRFQLYSGGAHVAEPPSTRPPKVLAHDLRIALRNQQLFAQYQQIHLADGSSCAAYVLSAAWMHPELGFLDDARLRAHAEQAGLLEALEHWVLQRALYDFHDRADHQSSLIMPLTAGQWRRAEFSDVLAQEIEHSGLGGSQLLLCLPASAWEDALRGLSTVWADLQSLGVRLCVSDPAPHQTFDGASMVHFSAAYAAELIKQPSLGAGVRQLAQTKLPLLADGVASQADVEALSALGVRFFDGPRFGPPLERLELLAAFEDHPGLFFELPASTRPRDA